MVCLLLCSCNTHSNRVYFTIDPEDRKIVLPVQIDDSITARLAFDSGATIGALVLDSTFLLKNPMLFDVDSLV